MTGPEELWVAHTIDAIGLTLNVVAQWPLLSMKDIGTEGIYQTVDDTSGIVFVRYGSEETVKKYIGKLGGMFTEVSMIGDKTLTVSGRTARRVTVRMVLPPREMYRDEPGWGIGHETLPAEHTVLTVIGFNNRDIQILAGYRIPEESLDHYRYKVEYMLNSISIF